jgi:hypothetical protein
MNNKTFAMFMLTGGLVLLVIGVGIVLSSMNQAIESPFSANINSTWNAGIAAIAVAVVGVLLVLFGILILFKS